MLNLFTRLKKLKMEYTSRLKERTIPYWKEHMSVGNYTIRYIHPKSLKFTTNGSEELYSVPIEAPPRSPDFYLENTITIN